MYNNKHWSCFQSVLGALGGWLCIWIVSVGMCLHIEFFGLFFFLFFVCISGPGSGLYIYIYVLHRCVVGFVVCFVCWLCLLCCCVWFWHGGVGHMHFFVFFISGCVCAGLL